MEISILIGGDICPDRRNEPLFRRGASEAIFGDLIREFHEADLSIVNLECPLIRQSTPITKTGPALGVPEDCVNGIVATGIDVLNLGNNHILDHGNQGIETTIHSCIKHGIAHVGAGANIEAARRILVREVGGIRLGILSCAEHEFSIATKSRAGANPLNVVDFVRNVQSHRSEFDYLIVLLHGGNEFYPYPRPALMDTCRFFVEQGANAVICQHSHCPGCYETYLGAPIIYGQGNLVFDRFCRRDCWHEGFLLALKVDPQGKTTMKLTPYTQAGDNPGARRMEPRKEKAFLDALAERSEAISHECFVEQKWHEFCQANAVDYLGRLYGYGRFVRRVDRRLDWLRYLRSKNTLLMQLNMIRCESHREAIVDILSGEVKPLESLRRCA